MLAELSIKNFAIIESISISFEKGLTVLSGETGAGKSIIIDAISLLVGGRGSAEFVRYGEKRAEIEGLFLLDDDNHSSCRKAQELGIEITDGMIVLRRDISASGKSICRINGKLVTLGILREIGSTLIDIHGQHEHQDLMNKEKHIFLLDNFDENRILPGLNEYQQLYKQYSTIKKQLIHLNENEKEMAHRLDLIQFQLDEIKKADLKPNEDEELLEERRTLANFEKIHQSLSDSYQALTGEQKGLDWISHVMSKLEDVSDLSDELKLLHENVTNSFYLLEEASFSLRNQLDEMEFDPNRLDYLESRLNEIRFLQKKYGETVIDILEYASKIEEEIDKIENRDHHLEKMRHQLNEVTQDLLIEANNITKIRKRISDELVHAIYQELKELYMDKTQFSVDFNVKEGSPSANDPEIDGKFIHFQKNGIDEIEFLISTNPGEPLKSLSKVASGGELSRIMLALKTIFSKHQGITSIIFDEVDTGVSGKVAQAMAEKIYNIAQSSSQVLCISHLPQVAAMADTHLFISKETIGERTKTSVRELTIDEKIVEIGRMVSGVEITDLTKQHAKELLDLAEEIKTRKVLK